MAKNSERQKLFSSRPSGPAPDADQKNDDSQKDKGPKSDVNENVLMPVSISLLYDGMVVLDDIYDADGDRLLMRSGNTLGDLQIDRIRNLNNGRSTIYVTGRTKNAMVSKRPNIDIESRTEIEETFGYTDVKEGTFELLEEIAGKKAVNPETLEDVSNELSERLESTPPSVIISLINAMAPVDEYLQRHSVNVSLLNGLIGQWLGLKKDEIDMLVLIGLLHDCGKTLLPPSVLNKPGKLTVVEFEVVKMHAVYTFELLSDFPGSMRISASSHHERIDGTGYPKKLHSNDLTLEARITAVSDIYDAMVSQRAYKAPRSPFSVLALLSKLCEKELDVDVVDIFKENMPKELSNKPITMSDGTIGIVREYDEEDIEYPMVELGGHIIKTNEELYCVSMFTDE